jgi:aldose 1-epimerase
MNLRPRDSACAAFVLIALISGGPAMAQSKSSQSPSGYSVAKKSTEGYTTYHLRDSARKMELSIVPSLGLFAYEFKVNGKDVFIPIESFKSYVAAHWFGWGNPFLAPWANRIDQDYYFVEGKKYLLNESLGNILRVPPKNYILHGLLVYEPRWEIVKTGASKATGAYLVAHLDFYKYPDLMANFPFAHTYEVTYRLKDGKLECRTKVANLGESRMPAHFGYHPYFRPDGPREEWTLGIGARKHWLTERAMIPTGETESTENFLAGAARGATLGQKFIDDTFSDLERDAKGFGSIWVKGKTQKIEVVYSREYDYAVVYAPLDQTLICIEPETGPTNAFNLTHEGKFNGLLMVEPGKPLEAVYWIVPTGY